MTSKMASAMLDEMRVCAGGWWECCSLDRRWEPSLSPFPNVLSGIHIKWRCRLVQESEGFLLEDVFHRAGSVSALRDLLLHGRGRNQDWCLLKHLRRAEPAVVWCCYAALEKLKLHCPVEGQSSPDDDGASSAVPWSERPSSGISCSYSHVESQQQHPGLVCSCQKRSLPPRLSVRPMWALWCGRSNNPAVSIEHCMWCVVVWRWWSERWRVVAISCPFHVVTTRSSSWKETETSSGCPTARRALLTVGIAVLYQFHFLFLTATITAQVALAALRVCCSISVVTSAQNTAANVRKWSKPVVRLLWDFYSTQGTVRIRGKYQDLTTVTISCYQEMIVEARLFKPFIPFACVKYRKVKPKLMSCCDFIFKSKEADACPEWLRSDWLEQNCVLRICFGVF